MKKFIYFCLLSVFGIFSAQQSEITIVKKPIKYSQERIDLSLEYLQSHYDIVQKKPTIVPTIIVLHYTAGGTVESNFRYFNQSKLENKRGYLKNESTLNVSSQFIVDRDGTIYQLMESNLFARHTIGLNYCAIGVENVGSKKEPLTDAQVTANVALVKHLAKIYNIEYLIGHSEYGVFKNTKFWKEKNKDYFTGKEDPGNDFMKKVRAKLVDFPIKDKP
ncbi:peptidoglycan recognition protein family protein [Frigoriflavimonas asaccharolytica]|uniref:N-acetylmuramoyl-L-alanine amidase n=1 Tax=Frigoriflavimonas asaccharolytica TaxID=2735899 RepID=A0A8J8G6Q5_9FLAO|nr:peptidoglycan recognition family protein [Frigoriflavimonas asaccharolytica]NRS92183.1 N-acetyl-anhydromuramyl-L-alanine amidase AmpD [Frigoriflavimonas asaccharolytica]